MTSPKDIVLNAWKTFSSRDAGRIAALFTDDAEWIAPKGNATAVALDHTDHMVGAQAIARFIAQEMHRMFSEVDIAFRGVYSDGDVVIVEERMRATLAGGKPYENDYCFVFTVAGDRIREVREYMDTRKGWRMVFGEEA
ncbi:nuclear transport factor 2 family protein [Bradyrhizobium japonicum]|uniref:nuclear transport factor 2 family protein n=1 Tax=Bradyrhizobium japonicum TaxID=375 RepID=UPI00057C5FA4|nr:nuclear transport factor 2 family protein [Bradyrhizobium japonicum]MCD9104777.1 nuclear transport factor 2 family protein [Bradyrhizobium japonicum]MCD9254743.1 nuclear transport factor 2 family protein [Bradyrhizobium japonicum SEMIA 5079]MCD9819554.1 nuclear transport factor 2 family protein [Bradyrhizobium japonicum]MCD9893439.1 nuclear transport factor 2 family protein [Bradyrhizobium japonicum]MCD9909191.1 nuclear transport factor 2 family protein [Bradyrhizobium japonicum]